MEAVHESDDLLLLFSLIHRQDYYVNHTKALCQGVFPSSDKRTSQPWYQQFK